MAPQIAFSEQMHAFIDQIATEVALSQDIAADDVSSIASHSSGFHADAAASSAANNRGRDIAMKRLLEPLIKNTPTSSQQLGLVLPPPPTFTATHLALRNVSGAYLVDAPCASRPSPHFSISKSPLRSPRSLSPLAKAVERLSLSTSANRAAAPAAAAALSAVALPAMLQEPIDQIRQAASACGVEVQSAIDSLQTALVRVIVEAFVDRARAPGPKGSKRKQNHRDSSKVIERSAAARMAMEDFQDMNRSQSLAQIPSPRHAPPPRPTTQSSQPTPTPRSYAEGYGFVHDLPLRSLKLSSSHQLLTREAAAEAAYKKRIAGKSSSQLRSDSVASIMSASGLFDAPAAPWPSATLESWPSKSSARVTTSFGENDFNFLQRESAGRAAVDVTAQSPSLANAGKLEMLRQCSRRPLPQFLQKIEADLDAALRLKGLPVDPSQLSIGTSPDSLMPSQQQQRVTQCTLRTPIFLDALALLGAAFPTYRGLIMRMHEELNASFTLLDAYAKEMMTVSDTLGQVQLIHAADLKRERERVMAHVEMDPSLKRKGTPGSSLQKLDAALAMQAANAEFVAQRRVKQLEKELDTASETIARLQEAVVFLRQQAGSKNFEELQLQHAQVVAHLRSIIKECVHRDDHNRLKEQLRVLQLENAQLLSALDQKSMGSPTASMASSNPDDSLTARIFKNNRSVTMKSFGTQTFIESSLRKGKYSLLEVRCIVCVSIAVRVFVSACHPASDQGHDFGHLSCASRRE